jgi:hypothetical protein
VKITELIQGKWPAAVLAQKSKNPEDQDDDAKIVIDSGEGHPSPIVVVDPTKEIGYDE